MSWGYCKDTTLNISIKENSCQKDNKFAERKHCLPFLVHLLRVGLASSGVWLHGSGKGEMMMMMLMWLLGNKMEHNSPKGFRALFLCQTAGCQKKRKTNEM